MTGDMKVVDNRVIPITWGVSDTDTYDQLVEAGKTVVNTAWLLGDLADKVETSYGENRLSEYARDIEVPYKTLLNARTVSRAFPQKSRRRELSFGVAAVLASQYDRQQIVDRKPDMTVAEARAIVRERKAIAATENDFSQQETTAAGAQAIANPEADIDALIRSTKRKLQSMGRDIPPERCDDFADILDSTATVLRRKAKAVRITVDREGGDE